MPKKLTKRELAHYAKIDKLLSEMSEPLPARAKKKHIPVLPLTMMRKYYDSHPDIGPLPLQLLSDMMGIKN